MYNLLTLVMTVLCFAMLAGGGYRAVRLSDEAMRAEEQRQIIDAADDEILRIRNQNEIIYFDCAEYAENETLETEIIDDSDML